MGELTALLTSRSMLLIPIYRHRSQDGTAMNGMSAKKGANSQRFYGCAYNENETNVRRADGEIDEMH